MKIITNWRSSVCNDCGQKACASVAFDHNIVCHFCGGSNLVDTNYELFEPIWKTDSRNPTRHLWSRHLRRFDDPKFGESAIK